MKNHFDLLVFDWDGTLVDSIDWIVHSIQQAALHCECAIPSVQASKDIIGLGLDEAMERLFPDASAATRERLIAGYRSVYLSRPLTRGDFFDGVYDLLHRLKRERYALAIATGKNRAGLHRALQATGTGALFSASRCADETASKPDPMMLFQLMQAVGVENGRTLMIGDSIHDLQMAHHANIASIAVSCGANPADALLRQRPLLCLRSTAELLEILI